MNRFAAGFLLVLGLALPGTAAGAALQDDATEASAETEVEKYIRLAREGRPVVRPQAARRLLERKEEASRLLLIACDKGGVADLGKDLVGVLGELESPELRKHLWSSLEDPDFPWRPSAADSIAKTAREDEAPRYDALLRDPIGRVRVAAIEAIRRLERRTAEPAMRAALGDQNDRVRRRAAALLADWGDPCALYWLLEDLGREDRFFALHTGKLARYESFNLLKERVASTHEYSVRKSPTDSENLAAMEAMRADLAALCKEEPRLPDLARVGELSVGDVLGLELRSCRRGEFFLRWNANDVLLVGTGNPARIALPAGAVQRLLESAGKLFAELEGQFWGEPGCDIEQFHFQPDPEGRPRAFRVNKGQAAVEGLRPLPLGKLAVLLCGTLPDSTSSDPRTDRLGSRVREALARLGGELPADSVEQR